MSVSMESDGRLPECSRASAGHALNARPELLLDGVTSRRDLRESGPFRFVLDGQSANQRLESSDESRSEIMIVESGWTASVVAKSEQLCTPWSVTYRPADDPKHDCTGEAGLVALRIAVDATFVRRVVKDSFAGFNGPIHYPSGQFGDLPNRILLEVTKPNAASVLMVDGLLRQLIASAARITTGLCAASPPAWLTRAAEIIEKDYHDSVRIDDVARAVGVHPVYLARMFRKHRGCSPRDFLSFLRLRGSANALLTSGESICSIAGSFGFYDQAHFSRAFRKWAGKTPLQFRLERRVDVVGDRKPSNHTRSSSVIA